MAKKLNENEVETEIKRVRKVKPEPPVVNKTKVIEAYELEVKVFQKKEKFEKYLSTHADDLKEMTTYKLNKAFTVKGYRITKIKGEIGLATQHYIPKSKLVKRKEDLQILNDKINLIVEILKERGIIRKKGGGHVEEEEEEEEEK
jgi:hypothetical protein